MKNDGTKSDMENIAHLERRMYDRKYLIVLTVILGLAHAFMRSL